MSYEKESAELMLSADSVHPKFVRRSAVASLVLNAVRQFCVHEVMRSLERPSSVLSPLVHLKITFLMFCFFSKEEMQLYRPSKQFKCLLEEER